MDSLRLLDGIVDIYMPDFKFWDVGLARRYLKAKDYPDVARRVIREMHRQVGALKFDENGFACHGVLVRHLIMPSFVEDTKEVLRFLAEHVSPDTYVNLMNQYSPAWKKPKFRREEDSPNRCLNSAKICTIVPRPDGCSELMS